MGAYEYAAMCVLVARQQGQPIYRCSQCCQRCAPSTSVASAHAATPDSWSVQCSVWYECKCPTLWGIGFVAAPSATNDVNVLLFVPICAQRKPFCDIWCHIYSGKHPPGQTDIASTVAGLCGMASNAWSMVVAFHFCRRTRAMLSLLIATISV